MSNSPLAGIVTEGALVGPLCIVHQVHVLLPVVLVVAPVLTLLTPA